MLSYTQRAYTHYTALSGRVVRGIVLHHSGGSSAIDTFQSLGGWHWMIDKARLYKDVPEELAAWHDAATDRWRPPWVPYGAGRRGGTQLVSDINAVSIGIEIVYAPQKGEQPNDYQYTTLTALLSDLHGRYGSLPTVGHGETDLNREITEPTSLDWTRVGFGTHNADGRYWAPPAAPPEVPTLETSVLSDAELEHEVRPTLWGALYVPGTVDFAIPARWRAELRKGNNLGAPLNGEELLPSGGTLQRFERGVIFYKNGATSLSG